MHVLPAILSLLIGIAGWFYLFYSRAGHGLAGVEDDTLNRRRILLRRIGGVAMLLLAVCFYAGFYLAEFDTRPRLFLAIWMGVLALLAALVLLALIDVRLTLRLRRRRLDAAVATRFAAPAGSVHDADGASMDQRGTDREQSSGK